MTTKEIPDLKSILLPKFLSPSKEILNYSTKRLTAPGENYGSLMLSVTIQTKNIKTGEKETIEAVAKMVPNNDFIQKVFKTPITFQKELELYRTIVPTLQNFQKEYNFEKVIDFFPEFYGGRLGLHNTTFDSTAIILLENLKLQGFKTLDRTKGFDLRTSKLILRDLAQMHAIPIALKLKKPQEFKTKILPYLNPTNTLNDLSDDIKQAMLEEVIKIAEENPECRLFAPRIRQAIEFADKSIMDFTQPNEPYGTLIHCDYWVNNTLLKFDDKLRPIQNKMVDFQIIEYQTPTKDLTFFLFVSVQNDVLVNYYNELVDEYYNSFVETLKRFNVDMTPFSFEQFEKEIEVAVKHHTVLQCFIMLRPIFAAADNVKNVEELAPEDFQKKREPTQAHKEKLWLIVKEFVKRNWI